LWRIKSLIRWLLGFAAGMLFGALVLEVIFRILRHFGEI
jgi:hypothetical protein